jgi:hypothetical protein
VNATAPLRFAIEARFSPSASGLPSVSIKGNGTGT